MSFNPTIKLIVQDEKRDSRIISITEEMHSFGVLKMALSRFKPNLEAGMLPVVTENCVSIFTLWKGIEFCYMKSANEI